MPSTIPLEGAVKSMSKIQSHPQETTAMQLIGKSNRITYQLATFVQMYCVHYCWTLYNHVLS